MEQAWSRAYSIIMASNLLVDGVQKANVTPEEMNIALGQAYYWRAYAYFHLVRLFGPLPLILHHIPDNNATPLTAVEGIYAQIVSDLKAAEDCHLPAQYTGENRSIEGQNIYVSEQTVKATLAAVYMSMAGYPMNKTEYYEQAAAKAKEVIDGVNKGTYKQGLLEDWKDVYSYGKNHHFETLLGIDYNAALGGWSDADSQFSSCHQLNNVWNGWGDLLAERRYWKDYPEGPRKDAVYSKRILINNSEHAVDWWATTDGKKYNGKNAASSVHYRPMFIAFSVNKNEAGQPIAAPFDYNKPVWGGMCINKRHQLIRYAEVLCWYAESAARSQSSDLSEAKAALKKVRARAYTDQTKVAEVDKMNAEQLAEAAYNEHGYEVAGYVIAMVTRRADQFRMNRLQETHTYRSGEQTEVLVKKGTKTHSVNEKGEPFDYELEEDVIVKENMPVNSTWQGESSIYQVYPPTEVEKNPNLKR
ncbi:protein containing RagB/SusD domain protein [gut metagenome]|uniref:Protein containing RagB/SusD domain protein n=1 Tax=gut metagenome TaxID=749906 RepID=J9GEI5_9ZZZZ